METVIRDGLGEIRSNTDLLDDLFSGFKEAHFSNQFGQAHIDKIKTFIEDNQIRIVQSWAMVPTTIPCISISLLRADESEDIQHLGNEFEHVTDAITPEVLVSVVTPGTYSFTTGKLTITNAADLSTICPGNIFVDFSEEKFVIGSGNSNLSGNKFINIGPGKNPDLSGDGRIESAIDEEVTSRRMIRIREQISLGCHSKDDVHLAKYIYAILQYILKSRQESLIKRGIHLDRGIGGVYDRLDEYRGENIFSRFLEVSCITEFDWDQEKVNVIDCFDSSIKAPHPNPDSENVENVNTSIQNE